jgi:hypothetical protein
MGARLVFKRDPERYRNSRMGPEIDHLSAAAERHGETGAQLKDAAVQLGVQLDRMAAERATLVQELAALRQELHRVRSELVVTE